MTSKLLVPTLTGWPTTIDADGLWSVSTAEDCAAEVRNDAVVSKDIWRYGLLWSIIAPRFIAR